MTDIQHQHDEPSIPPDAACIVYFHGNDWDGVPGRQARLMEAMSHYLPVIFLDGTRDARFRVTMRRPSPRVVVVRGLVSILAALSRRGWHTAARIFARRALAKITAPYRRVIFWGAENWFQFERFVPHDVFVHDSIDPCFDERHTAIFAGREGVLRRKAAVVLCTAEQLLREAKNDNPQSYLIPNACAEADFAAPNDGFVPAEGTGEHPRPVIGYLGSIDSRLDLETLAHAATHLRECSFVLAGPVVPGQEARLQALRALHNVFFVGPKFGAQAGITTRSFDVGLIPFLPGKISDALNPVKMYTYLAAGIPVVTTWIHECVQHRGWVHASRTPADFVTSIERALKHDAAEKARLVAFARRNTWAQRAADVMQIFRKTGIVAP